MRWLLIALLVGCSAPADDALVVWHAYRGGEAEAFDGVLGECARSLGTTARAVSIPYDAFVNKVSVAIPRGNGPDIFISAHDRLGSWAASGLLEPVGFWADEALVDRFFLETVEPLVYRGDLYGLPLAFKTLALFYDRRLVDAPPESTAALEAAVRAAKAKNPAAQGIGWELDSLYFHAPWLHGFGGRVYSDEQDTLAIAEPAAARSLAFVRRWVKEGVAPEEATAALETALFRKGDLAFVVSGPWFRGELEGHPGYGVAALPVVSETGLRARPFLGVEGVMLSAHSRRKPDAFALMRCLTRDEAALGRFREGGQLVANRATYEVPEVQQDSFASAFREQVRHTVALSNRPHMRRVWTPVKNALSQGIVHGREPSEALREAVETIARRSR